MTALTRLALRRVPLNPTTSALPRPLCALKMAQAASMGPPLSPRETRRSGRRSAPSASASASKSPDSDQPPRDKAPSSRSVPASNPNRNRKPKQEEYEDSIDERKQYPPALAASGSGSNNANNKAKRKPKEKDKAPGAADVESASLDGQGQDPPEEDEEEQGITRCVCGSAGKFDPSSFLYPRSCPDQRMIPMLVNSWSNAKHAKCGSMGYAWVFNLKTKSTTMTTIVNCASRRCTPTFSSP